MTDQLTTTGLTIDTYQTRLAAITAELRAAISPVLDLSTDQPTGQFVQIQTEQIQAIAELLQELHSAIDPDQATGQSLDALCSITGTYRRAATYGSVTLTLTFTGAGTASAGDIVAVSGDPDNQWILDADVVAAAAGDETGTATAAIAGVYAAPAATITNIVSTAEPNWSAVTNASAASPGLVRETDTELRLRREIEVVTGGSTSADAVQAACSQITGMLEVYCYENPYWYAVSPMPPHSIEVVYWDGGGGAVTVADLAKEIFEEKAGGIQAYGTSSSTVEDSQGNDHIIGYTLADEQRIIVEVDIDSDGSVASATLEDSVEAAIAAWDGTDLGIGDDVYLSKISAVANAITGVANVSAVRISVHPAAVAAADITIGAREIATIALADITATATVI